MLQDFLRNIPVYWREGECRARDLLKTLAAEITKPYEDGKTNTWEVVALADYYRSGAAQPKHRDVYGRYIDADDNVYDVYKFTSITTNTKQQTVDYYEGTDVTTDVDFTLQYPDFTTSLQNKFFVFLINGGQNEPSTVLLVDQPDPQLNEFVVPDGRQPITLPPQRFMTLWKLAGAKTRGSTYSFPEYNDYFERQTLDKFIAVKPLPYYIVGSGTYYEPVGTIGNSVIQTVYIDTYTFQAHQFNELYYTYYDQYPVCTFKCTVNIDGNTKDWYVRFYDPMDARHIEITLVEDYEFTPEYIDEYEQHRSYEESWSLQSPTYYWFYGKSILSSGSIYQRSSDWWVQYWISMDNNHLSMVLEGDPAPGFDAYFTSFAYIGAIVPFNNEDVNNNFSITCGFGDNDTRRKEINQDVLTIRIDMNRRQYGPNTASGAYDIMMYKTRTDILFQRYNIAFTTPFANMPSYDKKNKPGSWTNKFHATPIYVIHPYEGYRGWLQDVVAIEPQLLQDDELIVDFEVLDDEGQTIPISHTYRYFNLKGNINVLQYGNTPNANFTVAIRKA